MRAASPPSPLRPGGQPRRFAVLAVAVLLAAGFAAPVSAQTAEGGVRTLGLGRAGVALGGEAWGHANPAAWAGLTRREAALEASQAFGLAELRLAAFSAAAPLRPATVALAARTYGFAEHRETRVVVGAARAVALSRARRLDVGVSAGVESATTEGVGSVTSPLLSVGVQADVVPGLRAGLAARNVLGLARGTEADLRHSASTVPALAVGLAYTASDRALLVADAEQDLETGLSVRVGLEARPVGVLALRAGVATNPARVSAGAGVRTGALRADLAVERHETLGLTPAVGVSVAF